MVRKTAKGIGKKGKNKRKRGNLGGKRKEEGSKKKEKRDCIEENTKNSAIWGCNLRNEKNSKKHLQFIKSGGIVLLVAEENTTQRTRYAGVVQW